MFISPTTFSACASLKVYSRMRSSRCSRNIDRRQHAGRIAGVDAGLFNVLHDSADDDVFAVGEGVDIDFDGVFEKVIDQHRAVVRVLDRLLHVADDRLLVVGDHHGASAKHIGRPHQNRIADALRACDRFFDRGRHHARRPAESASLRAAC